MSTIDTVFQQLRSQQRKALMPFIAAGDPDLEFTQQVIAQFAQRGCHLCELGTPYSDPIADGPVIQASYSRALAQGTTVAAIFQSVAQLAPTLTMPIVNMVSYAIVYRHGLARYVEHARTAGVAGLIVPDLPAEEARDLFAICRQADLDLIQLVTPTTSLDRVRQIADLSSGFLYYVSVTGITGERTALPPDIVDNVAAVRRHVELPICIGFGISRPDHVRMLAPVADGLIVGSAIVRRVATVGDRPRRAVLNEIGNYIEDLRGALDSA